VKTRIETGQRNVILMLIKLPTEKTVSAAAEALQAAAKANHFVMKEAASG